MALPTYNRGLRALMLIATLLVLSLLVAPSLAQAATLTPATWGNVQAAITGASNGDVLDLSGLSSPGQNLTTGPWYTFSVPANLTLTIKGNPVETFKYVAFNFGGNNTITIQDLHIESAQGAVTTLATTTVIHNKATLNFADTKGNTLIVEGDNSIVNRQASNITAQSYNVGAAIGVPWGTGTSPAAAAASELTITGTGSLYAQGGGAAAGIGSGSNQYSGFITITGAVSVTAVGGVHSGAALPPPAAGAGGGSGAGIGSGAACNFNGNPQSCPITIDTTGTINAYSGRDALVFLGDPYLALYTYLNEPTMAGRPAAASIGNGSSRQGGGIPGVPTFAQIGVMSYTMPADQTVDAGGTAVFTIDAVYAYQLFISDPTYQWQVSEDGGATWRNTTAAEGTASSTMAATAPRIGTATFTINPAKGIQDGNRYRVIIKAPTNMHPDGGSFNWSYVTITTHPAKLAVDRIGTQTTLSSNTNPSVSGQNVTLSATVTADAPSAGTPVGTVEFREGTTVLGTATLNASGVATYSTTALSAGSHDIVAYYLGDTAGADNFFVSNSAPLTQVVNQAATETTLVSNRNPAHVGEDVTFSATVAAVAPGVGMPTGTVEFRENGVVLGTGTLNASGVATLTISTLDVGTHPVVAFYLGNSSFATSQSNPALDEVIEMADTTTTVASSLNPSVFGQSVTFTATIIADEPSVVTPTGTVEFYNGTTLLGSGTLNSSGVATLTTSALPAGTHPITAHYLGSTLCHGSQSTMLEQVVTAASTAVALTTSANPSVISQNVTFTATVTSDAGTPTGTVEFYNGMTLLGTGTLDASGVATFSTTDLSLGTHPITASYPGAGSFAASDSSTLDQEVVKADSGTAITSSHNPSVYGESVTFTATVISIAPATSTPTGTVEFYDDTTLLGTGTLNAEGIATFTTSSLSIGTHNAIIAVYPGDAAHNGSQAQQLEEVVPAQTTTTLTSSLNPSVVGQTVTFTAKVAAVAPGSGTPTGTVEFREGSVVLGTGTLDASGVATFSTTKLTVGTHPIVAYYAGDTNFEGSHSSTDPALKQVVTAAAPKPDPKPDPKPKPKPTPPTGDSNNAALWMVALAVSIGSAALALSSMKRTAHNETA